MSKQSNYERYLNTYSGRNLLEKYSLDQEGLWKIRGEDPNCDMGGSHIMPELDIVEGKLKDVIEYGVELSSFWQWGGGGDFTLMSKPKKINPVENKRRAELKNRLAQLEDEMRKIKQELGA